MHYFQSMKRGGREGSGRKNVVSRVNQGADLFAKLVVGFSLGCVRVCVLERRTK